MIFHSRLPGWILLELVVYTVCSFSCKVPTAKFSLCVSLCQPIKGPTVLRPAIPLFQGLSCHGITGVAELMDTEFRALVWRATSGSVIISENVCSAVFFNKVVFTGWGCWPHAQSLIYRIRNWGTLVRPLPQDLFGMVNPCQHSLQVHVDWPTTSWSPG